MILLPSRGMFSVSFLHIWSQRMINQWNNSEVMQCQLPHLGLNRIGNLHFLTLGTYPLGTYPPFGKEVQVLDREAYMERNQGAWTSAPAKLQANSQSQFGVTGWVILEVLLHSPVSHNSWHFVEQTWDPNWALQIWGRNK